MSGTGVDPAEEFLGDPAEDPDSENPEAVTTFNPEDPESISPELGPVPEGPGAAPAPACRAALQEATSRFPARSRRSDGIMGDTSHQARKSDHNVGNAFDLTHDPANGCDAHGLVEQLRQRGDPRVKYIISQKRIWNPSISPKWRDYTGSNPHIKHAHVSIRSSRRDDTAEWWTDAVLVPGDEAPADAAAGTAPPMEVEVDMPKPGDVTDEVEFRGGLLQLTFDGGIRVLDRGTFKPHADAQSVVPFTPFSYPGLPPEAKKGERGFYRMRLDADGSGYTLIATDGSRYHFPT